MKYTYMLLGALVAVVSLSLICAILIIALKYLSVKVVTTILCVLFVACLGAIFGYAVWGSKQITQENRRR